MKTLLMTLLLTFSFLTYAEKGNGEGNGGSDIGLNFLRHAKVGIKLMQADRIGPKALDYSKLMKLVNNIKIAVVQEKLFVIKDGIKQEVVAINFKRNGIHYIKINEAKWRQIESTDDRTALALHEVLSLLGIETTFNYKYSSSISFILSDFTIDGTVFTPEEYTYNENDEIRNLKKFLALELEIGSKAYDMTHISMLRIFKLDRAYRFNYSTVDASELKVLTNWSRNTMGIYIGEDDYWSDHWDILDVYRNGKYLNKEQFRSWLTTRFMEQSELDNPDNYYEDGLYQLLREKVKERKKLAYNAIETLVNMIFKDQYSRASVYPLLDNDNENIQDAEWVVAGDGHLFLLNMFYWL